MKHLGGSIVKVAVVGLGSMGKRRIRLIKDEYPEMEIVGVDAQEERQKEAKELFGIEAVGNLDDALQLVTAVFVCTSPLSHGNIINQCLSAGKDVFTEINLVSDRYEENIRLAKEKSAVLFLSSTFLYRDEIKYINEQVKAQDKKLNYLYHTGQYLPDWHPWESFNNFFVKDKRTNGCREIFAIELPWIVTVFGDIKNVSVVKSKNTDLQVDYPDNFLVTIEHESGHKGIFAVDVVSRKAVRNLEVYGEGLYLSWNGTPTGLMHYDFENKKEENIDLYENVEHQEGYSASIVENAYRNEIKTFLEMVTDRNVKNEIYDFEKDETVLKWIDIIEK